MDGLELSGCALAPFSDRRDAPLAVHRSEQFGHVPQRVAKGTCIHVCGAGILFLALDCGLDNPLVAIDVEREEIPFSKTFDDRVVKDYQVSRRVFDHIGSSLE